MVNANVKGKRAELAVVQALTRSGIPARRHVRTGDRFAVDEGDIRLDTAPVTVEVKDWARGYSRIQVAELLDKLRRQSRPGDLGLLVCKRVGHADATAWDCWVSPADARALLAGQPTNRDAPITAFEHPVCFVFGDVIRALTAGGWVAEQANPFRAGTS